MKMKKVICSLLVATTVLSCSATTFIAHGYEQSSTTTFKDVPNGYWAKDQIDYFAQQGIVNGYTDGTFKPAAGVTREEFCKLLVATFKQPLENPSTPSFSDVTAEHWSYPYVEVCKDFLTGYANPFGGLPTFHPTESATREDIAVALVRMMGYTDKDASYSDDAYYRFTDGDEISPNILPYVSIAYEKGLITGYQDGSFGPNRGISRAETVVLLNRATKQAVTNINAELDMTANVQYSNDKKTATINIVAEEGTTVTVNGEAVKMSDNYYDEYEGNYVYAFETEGSKDFVVEGKKAGKKKTINLTAKYEVDAPTLTVDCPAISDRKSVTISGKVEDISDNKPIVKINNESVNIDSDGYWFKTVDLKEGSNTFTIVATNYLGKSTIEKRIIEFGVGAPELTITYCPETSDKTSVTISGRVSDTNDSKPMVKINNKSVYVDRDGYWSETVDLKEGSNAFTIVATNNLGKSTTEKRTIEFGVDAPTLTITDCPTTATRTSITISGWVKDINDRRPTVEINDESVDVDFDGYWSKTVDLEEGTNIFTIVATNSLGKSTTENRKIQLKANAPEIQFINCPETTTRENLTIKGRIKGGTQGVMLFLNDEEIYVNSSEEFSKTVTLKEGENTFVFRAVNDYSKEVTVRKMVNYIPETDE